MDTQQDRLRILLEHLLSHTESHAEELRVFANEATGTSAAVSDEATLAAEALSAAAHHLRLAAQQL